MRGRTLRGTYMRHLEFQSEVTPDLAERCFEYNTRLFLHTKLPVVTTVIFLRPPGPRGHPVFTVRLHGRVLHRWRFEWLKLWELDARGALDGVSSCGSCRYRGSRPKPSCD